MASLFVSHSSADKFIAHRLVDELRRYGHDAWYDSESLSLTDSVTLKISEGITEAEYAIVIISASFIQSEWCRREFAALTASLVSQSKKLIVIQVDGAPIPALISDIMRLQLSSRDESTVAAAIAQVIQYLNGGLPAGTAGPSSPAKVDSLVRLLLQADADHRYGENLLHYESRPEQFSIETEGVILIKPGGTFNRRCLHSILEYICRECRIRQMRLFSGRVIARRGLFERQYASSTSIATGDMPLTQDDFKRIREIYATKEFERIHGIKYDDSLVMPALKLTSSTNGVSPLELSMLWERGREQGRFHNSKPDGLNKIGYQRSVFPINVPGVGVRIVINGFIPGYRALMVNSGSRLVAIHVSTRESWQTIRDRVIGGSSNPSACLPGSIRREAAEGRLPLDPEDNVVNGQRNVCHSSATLFDGFRELILWFEYDKSETVLGQVCDFGGLDPDRLEKYFGDRLPDLSWFTRSQNLSELVFDVQLRIARDNLRGDVKFMERIRDYADRIGVPVEFAQRNRALQAFVEDGLRLTTAGPELYIQAIAKIFRGRLDDITAFHEVVRSIQAVVNDRPGLVSQEALALAYRISAGDLMFLRSPAYNSAASPQLFKSQIVGELAEQAQACAARTERNLIRDQLAAFSKYNSDARRLKISESPEWLRFLETANRARVQTDVATIVLCGGRSTRMASTIPKPILPLRRGLLLDRVVETLHSALGHSDIFASIGFRGDLIRKAVGDKVRYLSFEDTLGLGFRAATALETIAEHEGLVLIAYTDMPNVSAETIHQVARKVSDPKTFVLVESECDLSGHIIRKEDGRIQRIVQSRLEIVPPGEHRRDVGVYGFRNTKEFRDVLLSTINDNVRGEYMFADVVSLLVENGWNIEAVHERPEFASGVNTPNELLSVACELEWKRRGNGETFREVLRTLSSDYLLGDLQFSGFRALRAAVDMHQGPLHFFHWWDELWQ